MELPEILLAETIRCENELINEVKIKILLKSAEIL